jgi:hypothetical protein
MAKGPAKHHNMHQRFKAVIGFMLCSVMLLTSCKKNDNSDGGTIDTGPKQYSNAVAVDWMDLATEMARSQALIPVNTIRLMTYSSLALYESQLPEMPLNQSMLGYLAGKSVDFSKTSAYYGPASANAAMAAILRKFSPSAANLKTIDSLDAAYSGFLQRVTDSAKYNTSVQYGKAVAEAVFAWSASDGATAACAAWTPPTGPGMWEPVPPANIPGISSCLGSSRTFLKDIAKTADPGPAPAFSTDTASAWYKSANEVYQYAGKLSTRDSLLVNSWLDAAPRNYNTVSHMNKLHTAILRVHSIYLAEAALSYAKLNMAMYDAVITAFALKYKYTLQRPITYVRNNMGKNSWNTYYPTLPFPSYPSVLSTVVSAGATVWASMYGPGYAIEDGTQEKQYGVIKYKSIQDFVDQAANQRVTSGLNFRFATDAGKKVGAKIGELTGQLPFMK